MEYCYSVKEYPIWNRYVVIKKIVKYLLIPHQQLVNLKLYCVNIYSKALHDSSYLGSKRTITTDEWSCLITFALTPLWNERGTKDSKWKYWQIYALTRVCTLLTRVPRKRRLLVLDVNFTQPNMGPGYKGSKMAAIKMEMLFISRYIVITEWNSFWFCINFRMIDSFDFNTKKCLVRNLNRTSCLLLRSVNEKQYSFHFEVYPSRHYPV